MLIFRHKNFKKALQNHPKKIQLKFKDKMEVFVGNQFHYSLNNQALTGKCKGLRSINITGDIGVHYEEIKDGIMLVDIGSHSELY